MYARAVPLLDLATTPVPEDGVRENALPRDRIKSRDTAMRAWLAALGKADDPHGLRKFAVKIETIPDTP